MASRLVCPGCRGELEAVEAHVVGAGPVVDQRVTVRYLCHTCGAHVTRRKDPYAEETVEHSVPGTPARAATLTAAPPLAPLTASGQRRADAASGGAGEVRSGSGLVSLTYMSTATLVFGRPALRELLETSRLNNHAAGLTGMLLFDATHFIQTLEGPAASVDATFTRIGADGRHRDVIVALREDVDVRRFADWSMGFDALSEEEVASVEGFNDFMSAGSHGQQTAHLLGRAGVFHRLFRDRMR